MRVGAGRMRKPQEIVFSNYCRQPLSMSMDGAIGLKSRPPCLCPENDLVQK